MTYRKLKKILLWCGVGISIIGVILWMIVSFTYFEDNVTGGLMMFGIVLTIAIGMYALGIWVALDSLEKQGLDLDNIEKVITKKKSKSLKSHLIDGVDNLSQIKSKER